MNKFLSKLITLLEVVVGAGLLMAGITGFFSHFIFNALCTVMGFMVITDGFSKVDNPDDRQDKNKNNEEM